MTPRFKEFAPSLNRPQREEAVIQFWRDNGIFQKSVENRRADKPFVFLEGPPSANAKPGVHHILSRRHERPGLPIQNDDRTSR